LFVATSICRNIHFLILIVILDLEAA